MFSIFSVSYYIIILFLSIITIYIANKLSFWRRQGIPYVFSHLINLFRKSLNLADEELVRRYGPIVGSYELLKPTLIISDPKLINRILIEKFAAFADHSKFLDPEDRMGTGLFLLPYKQWKRMRAILNPAFKEKTIENILPTIISTVDDMIKNLEVVCDGSPIDIKIYSQHFALDLMLRCFFAIKVDSTDPLATKAFENAEQFFKFNLTLPKLFALLFPKISKIFGITLFDKSSDYLYKLCEQLIDKRIREESGVKDFIHYLINTENEDKNCNSDRKLSAKELVDNCMMFPLAATETISTTVGAFIHALAISPEVQQRLFEEIQAFDDSTEDLMSRLSEKSVPYLSACFKETIRLWNSSPRIQRMCSEDTYLDSLLIPKGCVVTIPLYAIHRDPNHYESPDQFIPERFLAENVHQIKCQTYFPFGMGPKICIGIKFAECLTKLCLIKLLKKFKFVRTQKSGRIEFFTSVPFIGIKELIVGIEDRIDY